MSEEKESGFRNNKPKMDFQHVIFQKLKEKRSVLLSIAFFKERRQELRPKRERKGPRRKRPMSV